MNKNNLGSEEKLLSNSVKMKFAVCHLKLNMADIGVLKSQILDFF